MNEIKNEFINIKNILKDLVKDAIPFRNIAILLSILLITTLIFLIFNHFWIAIIPCGILSVYSVAATMNENKFIRNIKGLIKETEKEINKI